MVAICIPTYENISLVKRLLDSIKLQIYTEYIVVISDDSLTNSIERLILSYKDLNIVYHRNEKPMGTSNNINKALKIAFDLKVDYIKIMFQDDWFAYDYSLQKFVQLISSSDFDVLFSANFEKYFDSEKIHIANPKRISKLKDNPRLIFSCNCLGAPSNLIYKTCDVMFDPDFTWLLDVDFYLRLLQGRKMEYFQEPLINIGHDGNQLTDFYMNNPSKMYDETKRQFKKNKCFLSFENLVYFIKYSIKYYKNKLLH